MGGEHVEGTFFWHLFFALQIHWELFSCSGGKKEARLFLCTPCSYVGRVEVQLHSFVASAPGVSEC
jgi:hypothetical protein